QQQTVSGCGMSGIAFSTNVPHTVRGKDGTKQCTDCHPSAKGDNNAIMAQLLMQGTNYLNFMGRYAWVAAGTHGVEAVVVTERDEPQAVIGSSLHGLAFPDRFEHHLRGGRKLHVSHEHPGKDVSEQFFRPHLKADIRSVLARGEYLYAACGEAGLRVFDISFIDHKGFSERIFTAPVSPAGQQFFVRTKDAAAVAAPTTIAPDPTRSQLEENREQKVHPMYGYLYVADRCEGLILVGAATLLDGNPLNNFLKRDVTFNPGGVLNGARALTVAGTYVYVCCDKGLVVVDVDDPKNPKVTSILGEPFVTKGRAVQVQFRYAFVCDANGVTVLDVTHLDKPRPVWRMPFADARNIYVARTHAYVAGGKDGLIIMDVTDPEHPVLDQVYNAGGAINDLNDVKLGITYTSEFAYLADGKNGMRVVQLTSPQTPGNGGFAPRPTPRLIATHKLPDEGKAYAVGKGLDRDRAVDESGNQIAVFGRVGARPLNGPEQRKMYLRGGQVYKVDDDPLSALYRYVKPAVLPAPAPAAEGDEDEVPVLKLRR
ncbi:MAG: LVIVD repeat-containing protein, partial [Gemmataceae bacterium]